MPASLNVHPCKQATGTFGGGDTGSGCDGGVGGGGDGGGSDGGDIGISVSCISILRFLPKSMLLLGSHVCVISTAGYVRDPPKTSK